MHSPQTPSGARIAVDGALCTASGVCVSVAADLFSLPSGGYCAVVTSPVVDDPGQIARAEEAAAFCPTGAILVSRDP